MPASSPWIAAQQPPCGEVCSAEKSMPGQRLARIMRTGRAEAARRAEKRTQAILIDFDETNDYPRHRCNCIMSLPASSASPEPARRKGRRKRNTRSSPANCPCCARNASLNSRLILFRLTASRSIFRATINPRRGCARSFGFAKAWMNSLLTEQRNRITAENSSAS